MQVSTPDYYPDRDEVLSPEAMATVPSPQSDAERSLSLGNHLPTSSNAHATPRDQLQECPRSAEETSVETAMEDRNLSVEVHCLLFPFPLPFARDAGSTSHHWLCFQDLTLSKCAKDMLSTSNPAFSKVDYALILSVPCLLKRIEMLVPALVLL